MASYPQFFAPSIKNGLVSYWMLDGNAVDTYNGYDGTANNVTYVSAIDSTGAYFNSNANITLNSAALGQQVFTISAWFKLDSTSGFNTIVANWANSSQSGWFLRWDSSNSTLRFGIGYGNGQSPASTISSGRIEFNTWYHLVFTFDANYLAKMYINGTLVSSQQFSGAPGWTTYRPVIGANLWDGIARHHFQGTIDEVAYWNIAIGADVVSALYSAYNNEYQAVAASVAGSSTTSAALTVIRYLGYNEIQGSSVSQGDLSTQTLFSGSSEGSANVESALLQSIEDMSFDSIVYYTDLIAYKKAKLLQGLTSNSQKITNLTDGSSLTDAAAYGQLINFSSSIKNYINSADDLLQNNITLTSSSIKNYADLFNNNISNSLTDWSSSTKTYIDTADDILSSNTNQISSSIKSYIDQKVFDYYLNLSGASGSLKDYISSGDIRIQNNLNSFSSSYIGYVNNVENYIASLIPQLSASVSSSIATENNTRSAEDLNFLKLDGSRNMLGNLNVGNKNIINISSGSFSGDLLINGGLTVNGDYIYINKLDVADKTIKIATNANNSNDANGAGLFVDSANVSFIYNSSTNKWLSNIGLRVASETVYDSSLKLSGSVFLTIPTTIINNHFDVNTALHDLDTSLTNQQQRISNNYNSSRLIVAGQLTGDNVQLNLTNLGGSKFSVSELSNIAIDVLISDDTVSYTDNFVSSKLFINSGSLNLIISSPAILTGSYRLIAINQKYGSLLA